MAESAVSLAIDKLGSLLAQEVKRLKGIDKEVEYIKDELEVIRAFLKDADLKAEREGINEGVKIWVKQAREVAYHIEDAIDEYMLQMAQHCDQRGFVSFFPRISSWVTKLQTRSQIASEIQDIKENLQRIRERGEGFRFFSLEQGASSSNARRAILHDPRLHSLFIEEAEVVGIESPRNELIGYLVGGESQRTMITVVGMGGVGKTTLAKKVYDDPRVKEHYGYRAWITVSQSYDKEELLRAILMKFYESKNQPFPQNIAAMSYESLTNKLREYLQMERYLVVFDDIWEVGFWEDVEHALLENNKNSRVLITTRNKEVANICKRYNLLVLVHQMKPLPQKEAWELFCKKAFKFETTGKCPNHLKDLSHDIVRRCGGLPLAIVSIGGLLAAKEKIVLEWEKLLNSLGSIVVSDPQIVNVTNIISLSYGDLPYYLKTCFLYLGMFPEDLSIKRRRLIQLWVAEGFVQEKQGLTLEEVAEEYLTELIHRSLVQVDEVSFKGIPKTCSVHDLVRDVILSKSEELSFCHVSSNFSTFKAVARHLSIRNKEIDSAKGTSKSQTRSIMVFNETKLRKPIVNAIFSKFKLLAALDFQECPIDHIPKELGTLLHLKYLNLGDTEVSKLPDSIAKLHNLETLDLRNTFVKELPVEINKFSKLRHLLGDPKDTEGLKIHGSVKNLENLQTLHTIKINSDEGLISELGMLKQLRKVGIVHLKRDVGRQMCTALEEMTHLRSLWVFAKHYEDGILEVQSMSSPPVHLQSLQLVGQLERLPDWISKLQNLVKLRFGYSKLMDDPIRVLQALPSLKSLGIFCGYKGERMHFEGRGFQKLKWLHLARLDELSTMIIDKGALPILELLEIGSCPQMKKVPSGIQHLKDLKELSFVLMSNDFTQRLSCTGGEDYWMVKHVPLLQCDGTYDLNDDISYGAWVKRFH